MRYPCNHGVVAAPAALHLILGGLPCRIVDDPQFRRFDNGPFLARPGFEVTPSGARMTPAAGAPVHNPAAVDVIAEDAAPFPAADRGGSPGSAEGTGHILPFEKNDDLLGAHAVEVELVDTAHDLGFAGFDDAQPPDGLSVLVDAVRDPVAVDPGSDDAVIVHRLDLPAARLVADIVDEHLAYDPLDAGMQGIYLSVFQAVQADAQELQLAVEPRHVGLAPREPVQGLDADAVEAMRPGIVEQLAKPGAQLHGRAGDFGVRVFARDHAAQIGDAVSAKAELARDRSHLL